MITIWQCPRHFDMRTAYIIGLDDLATWSYSPYVVRTKEEQEYLLGLQLVLGCSFKVRLADTFHNGDSNGYGYTGIVITGLDL